MAESLNLFLARSCDKSFQKRNFIMNNFALMGFNCYPNSFQLRILIYSHRKIAFFCSLSWSSLEQQFSFFCNTFAFSIFRIKKIHWIFLLMFHFNKILQFRLSKKKDQSIRRNNPEKLEFFRCIYQHSMDIENPSVRWIKLSLVYPATNNHYSLNAELLHFGSMLSSYCHWLHNLSYSNCKFCSLNKIIFSRWKSITNICIRFGFMIWIFALEMLQVALNPKLIDSLFETELFIRK